MTRAAGGERDPASSEASPVQRVLLSRPLLARIRMRARASYPEECCGLLVGAREPGAVRVARDIPCPNAADPDQRRRRFLIDPPTLVGVIRSLRESGEELVGIYHSHPDEAAEPSSTDMTFVGLWPETVWLIVPVGADTTGEERAWWLPLSAREGQRPRELVVNAGPRGIHPVAGGE